MKRPAPEPRSATDARAQLRQALDELKKASQKRATACGAAMRKAVAAAKAPCAAAVRKAQRPCQKARKRERKAKGRTQTLRLARDRLRTPKEERETDGARHRKRRQRERENQRFHNADGSAGAGGVYDDDEALRAFVARKYKRHLIALSKKRKLTGGEAVSHYIHENRAEVEAAHALEIEQRTLREWEKHQNKRDPDEWDDANPRF